jgi:hypothetical protein
MSGNESVAISTIATFSPQEFIAINSEVKVSPTTTIVQDCSERLPVILGGMTHEGGPTTWTRN